MADLVPVPLWAPYKTRVEELFYSTHDPKDHRGEFRKKLNELKTRFKDYGEIYLLTNTENGKTYVGQTNLVSGERMDWYGSYRRMESHISDYRKGENGGTCRALNAAFAKYGIDKFTLEVLVTCKVADLQYYENRFMDEYSSRVPSLGGDGYNIREADQHARLSDETRAKMSEARRGDKHYQFGKPLDEAVKAKIAKTNIDKAAAARKDVDGKTILPRHMKYIDWATSNGKRDYGYTIVAHPTLKPKKFTSSDDSELYRKRNYARCLAYLNSAKA